MRKKAELASKIGKLFRAVRHSRDLTQVEFARAIFSSQSHLSKVESGIALPALVVWAHFCRAFDVSPECLLSLDLLEKLTQSHENETKQKALSDKRSSTRK